MSEPTPTFPDPSVEPPAPRIHRWAAEPRDRQRARLTDSAGIDVWVIELDGDDPVPEDPPIEDWFGHILSVEERGRAKRFIRARDRLRFARCRAAVRTILGEIGGISPSAIEFGSGPHGKPHLIPRSEGDPGTDIEFNVSHSGGLAVVAAGRGRPLGVDLEELRAIREADRIVESFFTAAEQSHFAEIDLAERPAAFLRGWTRKEAILKGLGRGLAGGPSNYETMFGTGPLSDRFQPAGPRRVVEGWMLWEASIGEGYVATLAVSIAPP